MGPLGTQEIVVIFILALLLFGPKKLPELGRTVAKALKEFRKAQADLKSTFEREMANLERETGIRELTATSYQSDSYNYDYPSYDSSYYDGTYEATATTSDAHTNGTAAASAAGATAPLQIEAAPGSIASGHLENGHTETAPSGGAAPVQFEPKDATHQEPVAASEKPVHG
jgi:sec-independent protein translocase protein TatA